MLEDAYETQGKLYKGTYDVITKAKRRGSGHVVVVKTYASEAEASPEVAALLRVQGHPNLIRCHQVLHEGKSVHLILEHCPSSLVHVLKANPGGLHIQDVTALASQILAGLAHMHGQLDGATMTYLNLRPAHVLASTFAETGGVAVKLINFRRAAAAPRGGVNRPAKYDSPDLLPQCRYDAPEVLAGDSFSTSADIWSVGCVVAEMLTGKPIFSGNSPASAMSCIMLACGIPPERLLRVMRDRSAFKGCLAQLSDCPHDAHDSPLTRRFRQLLKEAPAMLEFLFSCLDLVPARRPTAAQLLSHRALAAGAATTQTQATFAPAPARSSRSSSGSQDRASPQMSERRSPQGSLHPSMVHSVYDDRRSPSAPGYGPGDGGGGTPLHRFGAAVSAVVNGNKVITRMLPTSVGLPSETSTASLAHSALLYRSPSSGSMTVDGVSGAGNGVEGWRRASMQYSSGPVALRHAAASSDNLQHGGEALGGRTAPVALRHAAASSDNAQHSNDILGGRTAPGGFRAAASGAATVRRHTCDTAELGASVSASGGTPAGIGLLRHVASSAAPPAQERRMSGGRNASGPPSSSEPLVPLHEFTSRPGVLERGGGGSARLPTSAAPMQPTHRYVSNSGCMPSDSGGWAAANGLITIGGGSQSGGLARLESCERLGEGLHPGIQLDRYGSNASSTFAASAMDRFAAGSFPVLPFPPGAHGSSSNGGAPPGRQWGGGGAHAGVAPEKAPRWSSGGWSTGGASNNGDAHGGPVPLHSPSSGRPPLPSSGGGGGGTSGGVAGGSPAGRRGSFGGYAAAMSSPAGSPAGGSPAGSGHLIASPSGTGSPLSPALLSTRAGIGSSGAPSPFAARNASGGGGAPAPPPHGLRAGSGTSGSGGDVGESSSPGSPTAGGLTGANSFEFASPSSNSHQTSLRQRSNQGLRYASGKGLLSPSDAGQSSGGSPTCPTDRSPTNSLPPPLPSKAPTTGHDPSSPLPLPGGGAAGVGRGPPVVRIGRVLSYKQGGATVRVSPGGSQNAFESLANDGEDAPLPPLQGPPAEPYSPAAVPDTSFELPRLAAATPAPPPPLALSAVPRASLGPGGLAAAVLSSSDRHPPSLQVRQPQAPLPEGVKPLGELTRAADAVVALRSLASVRTPHAYQFMQRNGGSSDGSGTGSGVGGGGASSTGNGSGGGGVASDGGGPVPPAQSSRLARWLEKGYSIGQGGARI
ncbi:hypothetical protein FOA52_011645 [Chlamydomonas sp. UWO 241]|nr:hypothetical protein FOA52_011645 [Chlamydomonas sp. UWO 241]